MTKTKYIKVAVSDRLPEETNEFFMDKGKAIYSSVMKNWHIDKLKIHANWWLKEVPDHEEELTEMLEELLKTFNSCVGYGHPVSDRVKELLTKIKQ